MDFLILKSALGSCPGQLPGFVVRNEKSTVEKKKRFLFQYTAASGGGSRCALLCSNNFLFSHKILFLPGMRRSLLCILMSCAVAAASDRRILVTLPSTAADDATSYILEQDYLRMKTKDTGQLQYV